MTFVLPKTIKEIIGEEPYFIDNIGMSDSTVILFHDKVLKIQAINEESNNEYHIMEWLKDKLPVPKILGFERDDHHNYLLMSRIDGQMACDDRYINNYEQLTESLAEALKILWKIDISECPYVCNIDNKLVMANYNVENNLVDMDNIEPDTFGGNGFENPQQLIEWLKANKPEEELVLSHGDFCLPNIFLSEGKVSGYIDLGKTGLADKWQDIALCYRSLIHNFTGKYGKKSNQLYRKDLLFEKLGIKPNWEKIRYYILMDELF